MLFWYLWYVKHWQIFVTTFCDDFLWHLWQIFVTNFVTIFFKNFCDVCDESLWRIFVTNFCDEFLWRLWRNFVTNFCDNFCLKIFCDEFLWRLWRIFVTFVTNFCDAFLIVSTVKSWFKSWVIIFIFQVFWVKKHSELTWKFRFKI